MLILVATPIGNLQDFSSRAIQTLSDCDYILCEDTRHSRTLLSHFNIQKPLKSYHEHNEREREEEVIEDLKSGKTIALISDAGTPGISDPGATLVKACIREGIKVGGIPGPCAAVLALVCSGLDTDRFQFIGFLPRKTGELRSALLELLRYPGTSICYESPQRITAVLKTIHLLAPERSLAIGREMTKYYEEFCRGNATQLASKWETAPPKGEIVLLVSGDSSFQKQDWLQMSPTEHVEMLVTTYRMERSDAIKLAAEMRGVPKREVYGAVHLC